MMFVRNSILFFLAAETTVLARDSNYGGNGNLRNGRKHKQLGTSTTSRSLGVCAMLETHYGSSFPCEGGEWHHQDGNLDTCKNACLDRDDCYGFAYDNACYLWYTPFDFSNGSCSWSDAAIVREKSIPGCTRPTPVPVANDAGCQGCRKDLFAGQYVYCNDVYEYNNKQDCDWVGGTGTCDFGQVYPVSFDECSSMCAEEEGCTHFSSNGGICNLHLVSTCLVEPQGGDMDLYQLPPTPELVSGDSGCSGCRKDLFAGRYVYCDDTYDYSNKQDCDWVGGPGCEFGKLYPVSFDECSSLCLEEEGCTHFSSNGSICNLHLVSSCSVESQGGGMDLYQM